MLDSFKVPVAAYLIRFIVTTWFWKTKKIDRDYGFGKQGYSEGKVLDAPLLLATKASLYSFYIKLL